MQYTIRKVDLSISNDINDNNHGAISTMDKNVENWYYPVKCASDSYTLQSSHKIGRDIIQYVELVCDAVNFNSFSSPKQWYTPYEGKMKGIVFQVE